MSMTANQFLAARASWLRDDDGVQIRRSESGGGWQVLVKVDGNYTEESDARRIGGFLAKELRSAINKAVHAERDR